MKHPSTVLQYYKGQVYQMKEPMLGDFGQGGCPWARFGDMLVERGVQGHIILAAATVPGQSIKALMPKSYPAAYLRRTILSLDTAVNTAANTTMLSPTTVLFQQGESDAFVTSSIAYGNLLNTLVDWVWSATNTTMRVAASTWCVNKGDPALRAVQLSHGNGPNTDSLGSKYRTDNCHFNSRGLDAVARKWADVVLG